MKSYIFRTSIAVVACAAELLAFNAKAQTIAITGGEVYPVSGPGIENGTVVITNGKISAVGANVPGPAGAQRIGATGTVVTPGYVNSSTQLGVQEMAAVNNAQDASARGKANIAAAFTVWE